MASMAFGHSLCAARVTPQTQGARIGGMDGKNDSPVAEGWALTCPGRLADGVLH